MERSGRPGRLGGTGPRGGAPGGPGASAAPCPAGSAAGTGQAPPVGAGAAGRPGTPGRWGGTAAGSCPVAAPAPRSGGVAPRSPRPYPGRSSEEAAVTRIRSSHSDRPVEAAQPIIMPQRADLQRATSSYSLRRNRIAALPGRMRFSAQAGFGGGRMAGLGAGGGGYRGEVAAADQGEGSDRDDD